MANLSRLRRPSTQRANALKLEIARTLGCPADSIGLRNEDEFKTGHRFLYFQTGNGFGKLAADDNGKAQLLKEERNTLWAQRIGLTTAKVLHPYKESGSGKGILVFQKLRASQGSFVKDLESLSHCSRLIGNQYARLATDAILQSSHRPVPDFNPEQFAMHETAQSPELMLRHASKWVGLYDQPDIRLGLELAFPHLDGHMEQIGETVREISSSVPLLAKRWGKTGKPHFVHNDASIKNIYFQHGWIGLNDAFLIDFEHSTATHYPVLGLLKDLADLYGATAHNPYVQRRIIQHAYAHRYSHLPFAGGSDEMRALLRTVIIFGTLNFTQSGLYRALELNAKTADGLQPERIADAIAADQTAQITGHLLGNLLPNLKHLDALHGIEEDSLISLANQQYLTSEATQ